MRSGSKATDWGTFQRAGTMALRTNLWLYQLSLVRRESRHCVCVVQFDAQHNQEHA